MPNIKLTNVSGPVYEKMFKPKTSNYIRCFRRDPRAVLFSTANNFKHLHWTWTDRNQTDFKSAEYCSALASDVIAFREFAAVYPSRVKVIRYEDGAMNPRAYTDHIYQFLQLNISQEVLNKVKNMTSHDELRKNKNVNFSVYRKDPVESMNKWRRTIGFEFASIVDKNCKHLYEMFGYREVVSEDHLQSNDALVISPVKDIFDVA